MDIDDMGISRWSLYKQIAILFLFGAVVVIFLALPMLLAGIGLGWLLHRLMPSIEFGLSVLISLTAIGFMALLVMSLFLSLPKNRDLDDEDDLKPIYILPDSATTIRRRKPRKPR